MLAVFLLVCVVAVVAMWPSDAAPPAIVHPTHAIHGSGVAADRLSVLETAMTVEDGGGGSGVLSELASAAAHFAHLLRQLSKGFVVSDFYFTDEELVAATVLLREDALRALIADSRENKVKTLRQRQQLSDQFNVFGAGRESRGEVEIVAVGGAGSRKSRALGPHRGSLSESPSGNTVGTPLRACFIHFLELSDASARSNSPEELSRLSPHVADLHRLVRDLREKLPLMAARYPLVVFHEDLTAAGPSRDGQSLMTPLGIALGGALLRYEMRPVSQSTVKRQLLSTEDKPAHTAPKNLMGDKRNARDMEALKKAAKRLGGERLVLQDPTDFTFDKRGNRVPKTEASAAPSRSVAEATALTEDVLKRVEAGGKGLLLTALRKFVFPRAVDSPYHVPKETTPPTSPRNPFLFAQSDVTDNARHGAVDLDTGDGVVPPTQLEHYILPGLYFEPLESPDAAARVAKPAATELQPKQARGIDEPDRTPIKPTFASLLYPDRRDAYDYSTTELPSFITPEGKRKWLTPTSTQSTLRSRHRSRYLAIRLLYSRFFRDGDLRSDSTPPTVAHRVYSRQFDYFFRIDADVFLLGTPLVTSLQPPQYAYIRPGGVDSGSVPLVPTVSEQDLLLALAERSGGYGTAIISGSSSHQYTTGLREVFDSFVAEETARLATRSGALMATTPLATVLSDFAAMIASAGQLPHYITSVEIVDLNRYRTFGFNPKVVSLLEMLVPFASPESALGSPLRSDLSSLVLNVKGGDHLVAAGAVRHNDVLFDFEEAEKGAPKSLLFPPSNWGSPSLQGGLEEALLLELGGGDISLPPSIERTLRRLGELISDSPAFNPSKTGAQPLPQRSAKDAHEEFMLRYFEKEIQLMNEMEGKQQIKKASTKDSQLEKAKQIHKMRVRRAAADASRADKERRKAGHRDEQLLHLGFSIPTASEVAAVIGRSISGGAALPDGEDIWSASAEELLDALANFTTPSSVTDSIHGVASALKADFERAIDAIESHTTPVGREYAHRYSVAQAKALGRVLTIAVDSPLVLLAVHDYVLLYLHFFQFPLHNKRALLVRDFLTRVIDREAGGIYYNGWGDREIRTLAISLLLEPSEVLQLDSLPIQKGPHYHCPTSHYRFSLDQQLANALANAASEGGVYVSSVRDQSGAHYPSPLASFFQFFRRVTRREVRSSSVEERVKRMLNRDELDTIPMKTLRSALAGATRGLPSGGNTLHQFEGEASQGELASKIRSLLQTQDTGLQTMLEALKLPNHLLEWISSQEPKCRAAAAKQSGGSVDHARQEETIRERESEPGKKSVVGMNTVLPQPKPPGTLPSNPIDTSGQSTSLRNFGALLGAGWVRV